MASHPSFSGWGGGWSWRIKQILPGSRGVTFPAESLVLKYLRPLLLRGVVLAQSLLDFSNALLDLSLNLLPGIALHGADNLVEFPFDLFHFPRRHVFLRHNESPLLATFFANAVPDGMTRRDERSSG